MRHVGVAFEKAPAGGDGQDHGQPENQRLHLDRPQELVDLLHEPPMGPEHRQERHDGHHGNGVNRNGRHRRLEIEPGNRKAGDQKDGHGRDEDAEIALARFLIGHDGCSQM